MAPTYWLYESSQTAPSLPAERKHNLIALTARPRRARRMVGSSLFCNHHKPHVTKTFARIHDPRFFLSNAVCPYPLSLILAHHVCDLSRLSLHNR